MSDPRPDVELEAAVDPELERLLGNWVSGTVQVGRKKRFEIPYRDAVAHALGCDWIELCDEGYEFAILGRVYFASTLDELKEQVSAVLHR
jgi:hypothetical protein